MAEKILVTEALNELKTLDARITRATRECDFITASKKVDKNAEPGITKEDFNKKAVSDYQSVTDLIKRRETIKAAVIASNAVTEVEIAGEKMTVAKAIDTKTSIVYYMTLLDRMKSQYANALSTVERNNKQVEANIDQMILAAYGKEGKDKVAKDTYDAIAVPYKEANEAELVDPLKIKDEIDKLQNYIETFTSTVDSKLQISNCMTYIEMSTTPTYD